jgi:hypothetical protein
MLIRFLSMKSGFAKNAALNFFTAHGREDHAAQENPPEDGEQADNPPMPLEPQENEDRSLEVSCSPQEGHTAVSSSREEKTKCSKVLPHLLHRNS